MAVKTQAIDLRDALLTIMYTQEALIKLLVKKGIITEEGLLQEIKNIRSKKGVRLGQRGSYSRWIGFLPLFVLGAQMRYFSCFNHMIWLKRSNYEFNFLIS